MTTIAFNPARFRNRFSFSPVFDEVFNDLMSGSISGKGSALLAPVNIMETENGFQIQFAVPGFKKEDFKIEVNDLLLTVSAEVESKTEEENNRFTRREFKRSAFKRSFNLPENIDKEAMKATYTDGILVLDLARKTEVQPNNAITIQVN